MVMGIWLHEVTGDEFAWNAWGLQLIGFATWSPTVQERGHDSIICHQEIATHSYLHRQAKQRTSNPVIPSHIPLPDYRESPQLNSYDIMLITGLIPIKLFLQVFF